MSDVDPFGQHWLHDAPRTGLLVAAVTVTPATILFLINGASLWEWAAIPAALVVWYVLLRWDAADARLARAHDDVDDDGGQ